jgi:hypothetical protein
LRDGRRLVTAGHAWRVRFRVAAAWFFVRRGISLLTTRRRGRRVNPRPEAGLDADRTTENTAAIPHRKVITATGGNTARTVRRREEKDTNS